MSGIWVFEDGGHRASMSYSLCVCVCVYVWEIIYNKILKWKKMPFFCYKEIDMPFKKSLGTF